ncbi:hypothetical protein CEP54_011481 [Fusarium duplospermum]|uniref:Uncharacterized protein n=1 Tax=Fusarium duplospermum TaxID=1325734 RepID=A0A428PEC5_9HYPO|nr:hypothetical protein CEP54_011481 [Fusarium duplospermum]
MTTLASLPTQQMTDKHDDFFGAVDRSNFPNTEEKARPWLDLDLGWTSEWEPCRWTVRSAGKACEPIFVTVAHFYSNMTSGTWYALTSHYSHIHAPTANKGQHITVSSRHAESVLVLRRFGGQPPSDRLVILDEKVVAATQKMDETITFLKQLQESHVGLSDNVAKAQTKVLEQSTVSDLSGADFPCHEIARPNKDFVGRSEELRVIYEALDKNTSSSPRTVIISGGGGVGKSALALEAAHHFKNEKQYDAILWVNAENRNVLRESFTKLASCLMLKDAAEGSDKDRNFMVLRKWLNKTSKRWLMIYDNVNDFRLLNEYLPPETGSMIVTSRFYSFSYAFPGRATRISLQKFGLDDSLHLFNRYRKSRDPDNDTTADLNETKELLESIDGLALGIKQMAFYIASKGLSVSKFLDQYNRMAKYVLNGQTPDDRHSLGTLWNMQFEDIKKTNAAKLLGILSMAGADGFPRELLELDEPPDEEAAGWVEFCADPEELAVAIDALTNNALIEADDKREELCMHRLTQRAFLYSPVGLLEPSSLQETFDGLLFLLAKRFPHATASEGLWKHWATCSRYVSHVAALAHAFKNSQKRPRPIQPSIAFVKLMSDATWYLFEIGELNESKALLDIANEACPDKQSLEYAKICNVYVAIAVDKNDMEMGRAYSEKAIAIRAAQLTPTDAKLALSYNNFANTLNNEGKFSEALAHYTMADNILSDVEGTEMTVYGALAQLNMARSFAFKGDADKAIALFKSSGEFFSKKSHNMFLIGVEYTWASFLLKNNDPLSALGKLKAARDMAKDLIPFSMTLSGIYYKLGVTQVEMGLPMEAKGNFELSLKLAELHRREGEIARNARQLAALIRSDPQSGEVGKEEADELSKRAEKIKDAHWKAIEKFVPRGEGMEEEEEYNWLVAAWYR